jgi:hypothetical protein
MATLYLADDGNDANAGTSYALRFKTIAAGATAARTAPGDVIRMMASRTGSIANCSITNNTGVISIPSGTCKDVCVGDTVTGWTASANVTLSLDATNRRIATGAVSLAVATAFTTGKIAYFDLGSAQDFSAYQLISLWIRSTVTLASGVLRIDLCSDSTGDTPVHSFTINSTCAAASGITPTNVFHALQWDNGAALSSSIRSIAIVASKAKTAADCLTLNSIVSFTNTITDWWSDSGEKPFPVRAIYGDNLYIDCNSPNLFTVIGTATGNIPPYQGATKTNQTLYWWLAEPMDQSTSTSNGVFQVQEGGSTENPITYSGGWNRTDMSTQDTNGVTFICTINGTGRGLTTSTSRSWVNFSRLGFVRGANTSCYVQAFRFPYSQWTECVFLSWAVTSDSSNTAGNVSFRDIYFGSGRSDQTWFDTNAKGYNIVLENVHFQYDTRAQNLLGLNCGAKVYSIRVQNTWNNPRSLFISGGANPGTFLLRNISLVSPCSGVLTMDSTATNAAFFNLVGVSSVVFTNTNDIYASSIWSVKHGGVDGDDRLFMNAATVVRDSTVFDVSPSSWKLSITNASWSATYPYTIRVATVPVTAGVARTFTLRMRRDNVGLTMKLVAMRWPGLSARVESSITAAANTWETVSITFTSTISENFDIFIEAYGGTTFNGWWDNPTLT